MPELTFQERIENELDPEGLKRATDVINHDYMLVGTAPRLVASRVVAAYLLGASEPKP